MFPTLYFAAAMCLTAFVMCVFISGVMAGENKTKLCLLFLVIAFTFNSARIIIDRYVSPYGAACVAPEPAAIQVPHFELEVK